MRLVAKAVIGASSHTITTKPVDVVRWEAATKRKLGDGLGMGDMLRICHVAATRQGLTSDTFDVWAESLDDFVTVDDSDPNPPQPEPSPTG